MSEVALFFEKMHKVFKNKAQRCSTPLNRNICVATEHVALGVIVAVIMVMTMMRSEEDDNDDGGNGSG